MRLFDAVDRVIDRDVQNQSLSLFKSEEDSLHAVPLEPVPLARPQRLVTAQGRLGAPRVARLPAEPRQEEVRL